MAKGWLDNYGKQENYNNSKTSVPQGFVGEGYNTKGRNYSPAWGGQFQNGGKAPLYVESKNDPRYRAYQDSTALYNSYKNVEKALMKQGYSTEGVSKSGSMPIKRKSGTEYEKMFTEDSENNKNNVIKNNDGTYYIRDFENMMVNKTLPYQLFNKNIEPLHARRYHDDNTYTYTNTPEYMELNGIKANASPVRKDVRNIYNYSNVKPKQKVVVKPETKKSSDTFVYNPSEKRWEVEGTLKPQPKQKVKVVQPDLPRVEAINLPPMQQLQSIDAPTISDVVRSPKSYNVNMQRYNMQGPNDYYQADEEGVDYERAMQIKAASDAFNKDIEKRYGPQNEYRTPKSAKDAAERLKQLRSEFDMTPNYQMGGSVYPVNYVPQAQEGIDLSEYDIAMRGMMKSKIGMGNAFGNPAIKRMSQAMPKTGMTPEGIGTHYMGSMDNYAVPLLQDFGGDELKLVNPNTRSKEAIRFNSPEEAQYFAEHYKDVAPMSTTFKGLQEYAMGGSIPGAVGFSYARTQSPAPSNGKYAKKTMASAKYGDVIKDDMGQWNHPGEITEINSNDITMEGVPYNVLGVSDTGDTKLMKPGKNYKFKGKKVTEYPMAQNGLRQEQKGLQNLDQLTNFTNYNKPQPGGWLEAYK